MQPEIQDVSSVSTLQVRALALTVIQETLHALRTVGEIQMTTLAAETVQCLQLSGEDKTFNWWN